MTLSTRQLLGDIRLKQEVLALRRQVLDAARRVIESEYPELTAMQIEEKACDLADEQMEELKGEAQ